MHREGSAICDAPDRLLQSKLRRRRANYRSEGRCGGRVPIGTVGIPYERGMERGGYNTPMSARRETKKISEKNAVLHFILHGTIEMNIYARHTRHGPSCVAIA